LDAGKKITRRNWDAIPTPELVIARVNVLGKDQFKLFAFTDRRGRLIGDAEARDVADNNDDAVDDNDDVDFPGVDPAIIDPVEIPGVDDGEGQEHPTPQEIEILDDLDAPSDPPPVEAEAALQDAAADPMPQPEPRRSGRAKMPTKPGHVPSVTGSKCSHAVAQLESLGVLHPDARMFVQDDFHQSDPDAAAMVMTQLSLKAGLKAWGDSAWDAAHNEMKQLHFRDTFKPWHWRELSRHLSPMCFSRRNETAARKEEPSPVATNSKAASARRMLARLQSRWSRFCLPALSMQRKEGMLR
jgi:hypothetical protein